MDTAPDKHFSRVIGCCLDTRAGCHKGACTCPSQECAHAREKASEALHRDVSEELEL